MGQKKKTLTHMHTNKDCMSE